MSYVAEQKMVAELIRDRLGTEPAVARLACTDAMFAHSLEVVRIALIAVARELEADGASVPMATGVVRGALSRLLRDDLLAAQDGAMRRLQYNPLGVDQG